MKVAEIAKTACTDECITGISSQKLGGELVGIGTQSCTKFNNIEYVTIKTNKCGNLCLAL